MKQIRLLPNIPREKSICVKCRQERPLSVFAKDNRRAGRVSWCNACVALANKQCRRRLRTEFIVAYGGKCTCCGESNSAFLTLEHIHGDGRQHRESLSDGAAGLLRDLKKRGWPKDRYTLLCYNCNCVKVKPCPHKTDPAFKNLQLRNLLLEVFRLL